MLPLVLTCLLFPLSVWAVTGTTYEIDPSGDTDSTYHNVSGSTYTVEGSINPIEGDTSGSSYNVISGSALRYVCGDGFIDSGESCDGAQLNSQTCASQGYDRGTLSCSSTCTFVTTACESGGGGGGGGGGSSTLTTTPSAPTLDEEVSDTDFYYDDSFLLYGDRTSGATIEVDEDSTGVDYPSDTTWEVDLVLDYGLNTFDVTATNTKGTSTKTVFEIYYRLIGDITQDGGVSDYDLSKLVRLWGTDDAAGDFNRDGIVDDYDFSMMVARWGETV